MASQSLLYHYSEVFFGGFQSGQLVMALLSFTCIQSSVCVNVSIKHCREEKRGKGGEAEIRRKEKEIKEEADSPGLRSVPSDKVDQKGILIWMHTRT